MKSLMLLWRDVAQDLGDRCNASTTRDIDTVTRRFEHEGISFLTITLPDFGRDLDEALAEGKVAHAHFAGFRRRGGLPRFLGGFLELVFDRLTGVLLTAPSTAAIQALRQLTRLCSKVSLKCSTTRERAAYDDYVRIDAELEEVEQTWSSTSIADFKRVARLLFGRTLSGMDNLHATGGLVPKHGPGSTADGLRGNAKFALSEWTWRLESGGFTSVDYLVPNQKYWHRLEHVRFAEPGNERPVKVIGVPKTLKTPRIIAVEPTCMQYAQQAVAEPLVKLLESDKLTRHLIGFTRQEPNQNMARLGSRDGSLATLDLSEASDRVSNQLVCHMLHGYTHLLDAVQSCRSLRADVPGQGIIPLIKFASMGSALCFPIEAMVFLTAAFVGIESAREHRLTVRDVQSLIGQVRVYGDDIIVPAEYAYPVSLALNLYGFKVNPHKSFWTGKFRESCGKEYFDGNDVSVVKVRQKLPKSRQNVSELIATVSLRNQLYWAGFDRAVRRLDERLGGILKYYPFVSPDSQVLGRETAEHSHTVTGWNPRTHVATVKGWSESSKLPLSESSEEFALLKYFLKRSVEPYARKHLERSGRPRAVSIKLLRAPV
jgi:hypothetical protein